MRTRIAVVVGVVVAGLALPPMSLAQTGLFHAAREFAARVVIAGLDLGTASRPSVDWYAHEPMIDDFTDDVGQAATLWGQNQRLILIVGCRAGKIASVGIGLGGGRRVPTPNTLFQNGDVDIRWGDGPVESIEWLDGDLVLVAPVSSTVDFLSDASRENRLRVRARLVRNTVIQDEFDLGRLEFTPLTIRFNSGPQDLSCARAGADPVLAQREIARREQERREQERHEQAARARREQERRAEQAQFLANISNTPIMDGITGPIADGSAGIQTSVGYARALFPVATAGQLSRARRSGQYVITCAGGELAADGGIVLRSCLLAE